MSNLLKNFIEDFKSIDTSCSYLQKLICANSNTKGKFSQSFTLSINMHRLQASQVTQKRDGAIYIVLKPFLLNHLLHYHLGMLAYINSRHFLKYFLMVSNSTDGKPIGTVPSSPGKE